MNITWRDGVATLLTGLVGVVTYARLKGYDWPLLGSWRLGSLGLLVIGLGTCIIVGSGIVPTKDTWTIIASVLGGLAFASGLVGVIFNSQVAFATLAVLIGVLWLFATLHHLIASPGR